MADFSCSHFISITVIDLTSLRKKTCCIGTNCVYYAIEINFTERCHVFSIGWWNLCWVPRKRAELLCDGYLL